MTIDGKPISAILREKKGAPDPTGLDPVLREPEVLKHTGWSRSTLWLRVRDGEFPKPLKLGEKASGWFASDVKEYQDRIRAKRSAAS
jgi:prophage regulatory protein